MTGRWTLGLCLTVLACGATTHRSPVGDGKGGASSADGGAGGDVATVELSLDVVQRVSDEEWELSVGTHVRIDGAQSSLEVLTDDEGHAQALVVDDGPWDVTVARAGCSPISVVGVSESLSGPVHLYCRDDSEPDPEPQPQPELSEIAGAIQGRNWPGSVLKLSGPRLWTSSDAAGSYSAKLEPSKGSAAGRLLASEWDSRDDDAKPLNAVWVDLPESGDAPVDIVLPTPPRELAHTTVELELPSSGAVVGADLVPRQPRVTRDEDDYSYEVGRARFEAGDDGNHYSLGIEAFTEDLAPGEVGLSFNSPAGEDVSRQIFFSIDPAKDESVSIPAADVLETSGTTLDELSVAWSAPGYAYAGASIRAWEGGGAWFVYSFAGSESPLRAWPRLPEGVTRAEVGLDSDDFRVNVFAVSQDGVPWDWQHNEHQQAIIVSSRVPVEEPRPEARHTGPLNAYDGIYTLSDVTMNPASCSDEGPSIREEYYSDYFVVVGSYWELQIAGCSDLDTCRALAMAFWEDEWMSASWDLSANLPGLDGSSGSFDVSGSDVGELCTGWFHETASTTVVAGKQIRFDVEIVQVPPFPREEDSCVSSGADFEGIECSQLRVITGQFLEAI